MNRIYNVILLMSLILAESIPNSVQGLEKSPSDSETQLISEYIQSLQPSLSDKETSELAICIEKASHRLEFSEKSDFAGTRQIDKVSFLIAVVQTESQFKREAVSHKGAMGILQIMPRTAEWLADKNGIVYSSKADLNKPDTNLTLGVLYLNELMKSTGSPKNALLAYNAGPSGWKKWGGLSSYPKSIAKNYLAWLRFKSSHVLELELALNE